MADPDKLITISRLERDELLQRFAVILRFENCLCATGSKKRQDNVIHFPKSLERHSSKGIGCSRLLQAIERFSPTEYERMVRARAEELRWSSGAIWFVRSLSQDQDTKIFLLSDLAEPIVEKKSKSALVEAEIIASRIGYQPASGMYETTYKMDRVRRANFITEIIDSKRFERVIYVGLHEDLDLVDHRATSILFGQIAEQSRPAQFGVRNFMEASSAVLLALGEIS